jgi:hypothetical protein
MPAYPGLPRLADPAGLGTAPIARVDRRRPRAAPAAGRRQAWRGDSQDVSIRPFRLCTPTARHDPLERKPARALGQIRMKGKKARRAMTAPQLRRCAPPAPTTSRPSTATYPIWSVPRWPQACSDRQPAWPGSPSTSSWAPSTCAATIRVKGRGRSSRPPRRTPAPEPWYFPSGVSRCSEPGRDSHPHRGRQKGTASVSGTPRPLARSVQHSGRPTPRLHERGLRLGDLPRRPPDRSHRDGPGRSGTTWPDRSCPGETDDAPRPFVRVPAGAARPAPPVWRGGTRGGRRRSGRLWRA